MTIRELIMLFHEDEYLSTTVIANRLNIGRFRAYKFLKELIHKNLIHKNDQGNYVFNEELVKGINIIFLDIDGVLNCRTTTDECDGIRGIEDAKVLLLKTLVSKTKAKIVLISSWRLYWYKEEHLKKGQDDLANYLDQKMTKFELKIYGKASGEIFNRGEAVLEYIERLNHKGIKVNKYVILDDTSDDYLSTSLTNHLIKTDFEKGGLQKKHIGLALKKMAL